MSDPFPPAPDLLETSPRLGIRYLMLWMACSGILLTARKLIDGEASALYRVPLQFGLYDGGWAINYGMAVAGLIVCLTY